jgi:hypothetical protein
MYIIRSARAPFCFHQNDQPVDLITARLHIEKVESTAALACPNCGNNVTQLTPIEPGLKLQLHESGIKSGVPEQACAACYAIFQQKARANMKLRAEFKAKEDARLSLWTGRVTLVKQGRTMMKSKSYSEAAVAYEKYIRSLEIAFDAKPGGLLPEHFKSQARQSELTIIASVYWDLMCVYDSSPRYGNRMIKAADKLAEFSRYTPIYASIVKKAQTFLRKAKNPKVIKRFLKAANAERPRCFVATAVFQNPTCIEIQTLCLFRDEVLKKSQWGRHLTRLYYKFSPSLAALIDRFPFLRALLRPILTTIAAQLRRSLHLNSNP